MTHTVSGPTAAQGLSHEAQENFHLGYRSSLDGVRGVAILLVLPWRNLAYLLLVLPVVSISYYLIERPWLRLKGRFQMVR